MVLAALLSALGWVGADADESHTCFQDGRSIEVTFLSRTWHLHRMAHFVENDTSIAWNILGKRDPHRMDRVWKKGSCVFSKGNFMFSNGPCMFSNCPVCSQRIPYVLKGPLYVLKGPLHVLKGTLHVLKGTPYFLKGVM